MILFVILKNLHFKLTLLEFWNLILKSLNKEKMFNAEFSLLNSSFAPIDFDLSSNRPFYFNEFSNKTERFSLKPKTKLKVIFNVSIFICIKNRYFGRKKIKC